MRVPLSMLIGLCVSSLAIFSSKAAELDCWVESTLSVTRPSESVGKNNIDACYEEGRRLEPSSSALHWPALRAARKQKRAEILSKYVITPREEEALKNYISFGFRRVNAVLRRTRKIQKADREQVSLIRSALEKIPAYQGVTFRGTGLPNAVVDSYRKIGNTVHDKAFLSTDLFPSTAERFIKGGDKPDHTPVILVIEGKSGRLVDFMSENEREYEVLFFPDTSFEVMEVQEGFPLKIRLREK